MYLTMMRPDEIQDAVRRNLPVLMAAGVVEYHGPHLPIGTDILIAKAICVEVEQQCECVVVPEIAFGPTMSWAGGADEGEIDFDPDAFYYFAKEALHRMMKLGFKRIYVLQHHQGLEGLQSLSLRKAAAELIREKALTLGDGWGRAPIESTPVSHIFNWITVAGLDSFSEYPSDISERIPIGHAGKGETQLILASHPDTVRLELLSSWRGELPSWLEDATQASKEEGRRWLDFCVQGWVKELSKS